MFSEYDVIVLMEYKLEDVKVKKPRLQVLFCWRYMCIMGHLARIPLEYKLERTEVKSSDLALHVYQGDSMDFYSYSSRVVKNHAAF